MSQVTEQSVRFQTALASIKLIQASAVLDLTEDDFDFLTSNKVWIATDRSRARRCVEACVYGTLDFVGYPRFPAPVEFIAESVNFCVMEAIKLCRLDTPIIFIEARINLSRFVVTGCAAKTSATVTFPSLNLISLFAFCFNIWLNGVAS